MKDELIIGGAGTAMAVLGTATLDNEQFIDNHGGIIERKPKS